jgi:adenylate kinase family enzyme
MARRYLVTGASGTGATTLGRALAQAYGIPHHDADDFYWVPTDPPYRAKRPIPERVALMRALFLPRAHWVLSGSVDSWGEAVEPLLDAAIFLTAPAGLRALRIAAREAARFGAAAVGPGGWRQAELAAFLDWSAGYDAGDRPGRSRARHDAWLATLACPVIRLDGALPLDALTGAAMARLVGIERERTDSQR